MLAKAAGGSSAPKFIKDTGNESLIQRVQVPRLRSDDRPGLELLFVEKYGETLYREAFTETAEKINGRLAQVGFVLAAAEHLQRSTCPRRSWLKYTTCWCSGCRERVRAERLVNVLEDNPPRATSPTPHDLRQQEGCRCRSGSSDRLLRSGDA